MSTVGVAPYLSEGYSFGVFDQIRDLVHDALRRLTAEPGRDFWLPFECARQAWRIVRIDDAQFGTLGVGGDLLLEVSSQQRSGERSQIKRAGGGRNTHGR
jgi:hypothetical protein